MLFNDYYIYWLDKLYDNLFYDYMWRVWKYYSAVDQIGVEVWSFICLEEV